MIEDTKISAVTDERAYYSLSYLAHKYDAIKDSTIPYALIQFNIKNFRYFNTKYGCQAGDEILALVLERIRSILEADEYAAYLYADNFAALLQYEHIDALMYERMMHIIEVLYRIEDDRIYRNLSVSMGIYEIKDAEVMFHDALNYANLSRKESDTLYCRSFCMEVYDQVFHHRYMSRMELETDTANAYKNYEFVPFFQPKVDLKTGEIVGAEALLRWFDKDGNLVPLYTFLPILNQNNYIRLIDLDIIDLACKHLEMRVKNNQKAVPISFNVSKAYFNDPNLLKDYKEAFSKYDIPKTLLEVELMESISLDDTKRLKEVITGFKEFGITCALDDFGNGYSSFNVLLNAQLDTIKMDRQFFLNNLNGDNKLIIKTIVEMIHSLNMKVVAEGVETHEHVEWLKECHCDYVQGYYYYKPMSMEDFETLLDAEEKKYLS